ncbi:hypothetical protein J4410_05235 [Candidatus Woesearchaeota archaeon]|nr:hypothetical protein [Candidatus Woesearchaeota archaeon]
MNFDQVKLQCSCGSRMRKMTTSLKGISVRGWECEKCHEEMIHPEDAQKVLEIEKARKKNLLTVKLRKVGKSNVITVPKIIMETEHLKEGQKFEWKKEGKKFVLIS